MLQLLIPLLLVPLSAPLAGLSVWLASRREVLEDGDLLRRFLILLGAWMLLIWGVSHMDSVRFYIDPVFRISTQLAQHPVFATIDRLSPSDAARLKPFVGEQLMQGVSVTETFLRARPLLSNMATERLGFADQKTRLAWGQSTLDTLRELQAIDPAACYRTIATKGADPTTPWNAFSQHNTEAFQRAVVAVYESANEGMSHTSTRREPRPDIDLARREYSAIDEDIIRRFGKPMAKQLTKTRLAQARTEPSADICSARIFQLEEVLKRPQPLAATLVDAVLR